MNFLPGNIICACKRRTSVREAGDRKRPFSNTNLSFKYDIHPRQISIERSLTAFAAELFMLDIMQSVLIVHPGKSDVSQVTERCLQRLQM